MLPSASDAAQARILHGVWGDGACIVVSAHVQRVRGSTHGRLRCRLSFGCPGRPNRLESGDRKGRQPSRSTHVWEADGGAALRERTSTTSTKDGHAKDARAEVRRLLRYAVLEQRVDRRVSVTGLCVCTRERDPRWNH
mmetsp:Transcript_27697/g.81043  ORF Transcript_27697/g.81043 Transcript_27697/m.81043 type:complete len:138 (-) Transcript_27697:23-436(-)|eukprot:783775-Prymnesium_polylepis.1